MRTFLDPTLTNGHPLLIVFSPQAVWYGVIGVVLAIVAMLIPALRGVTSHDRHVPLVAGAHAAQARSGSVTFSMGCC